MARKEKKGNELKGWEVGLGVFGGGGSVGIPSPFSSHFTFLHNYPAETPRPQNPQNHHESSGLGIPFLYLIYLPRFFGLWNFDFEFDVGLWSWSRSWMKR